MKTTLVLTGFLLLGTAAVASADGGFFHRRGERIDARLDRRGARINERLDRRGDAINARLDALSEKARAEGKYGLARRLDRKGDLIEARLDRRGDRIERRFDRRGDRIERRFDRRDRMENRFGRFPRGHRYGFYRWR